MSDEKPVTDNASSPSSVQARTKTVRVQVRKKRTFIKRAEDASPTTSGSKIEIEGEHPAEHLSETQAAQKKMRPTKTAVASADVKSSSPVVSSPYVPLESVPAEMAPWQVPYLLKKTGVFAIVTPPGACSAALGGYFAKLLSGRVMAPMGAALYPGDVLYSTYTQHLDRCIRASAHSTFFSAKEILTSWSLRRFDWKQPMDTVENALAGRRPGGAAAVIIDTGPFPTRLSDRIIDDAYAKLSEAASRANCLVLLMVEVSSREDVDPFRRLPTGLRALRGTILAAPLRSKSLGPHVGDPAQFMLMRLAEASSHSLVVRFSLLPMMDYLEGSTISWGAVVYDDPRNAFRQAAVADLSQAERIAITAATEIIRQKGLPLTAAELKALGNTFFKIAPTTMRDALTVAGGFGLLVNVHDFNNRSFWAIPGVTPIPPGLRLPYRDGPEPIPF